MPCFTLSFVIESPNLIQLWVEWYVASASKYPAMSVGLWLHNWPLPRRTNFHFAVPFDAVRPSLEWSYPWYVAIYNYKLEIFAPPPPKKNTLSASCTPFSFHQPQTHPPINRLQLQFSSQAKVEDELILGLKLSFENQTLNIQSSESLQMP